MDIVFTLAVWVGLLVLVAHGLRLSQLRHDEPVADTPVMAPAPARRVEAEVIAFPHPVTAFTPDRTLTGAGAPR